MTRRVIQARTAVKAALGMAAAVIALLAWGILSAPGEGIQQSVPVVATALVIAVLLLPMLGVVLRAHPDPQQTDSRLEEFTDGLPGAVFRLLLKPDGTTSYDFLSIKTGQVRGVTRDNLLRDANTAREVVLDEDRPLLDAAMSRSAGTLSDVSVQFRIRKPDGAIRWLQCAAVPRRLINGDVVWHGCWTDITKARVAEQALRDSAERLEAAQGIAGIGDWTWDMASGALAWSRQMYAILQREPALGPPSLEEQLALFDQGGSSTADALLQVQETGETQEYDVAVRRNDASELALQLIVVAVKDAAGAVVGMRGTVQDITARKAVEAQLLHALKAADSTPSPRVQDASMPLDLEVAVTPEHIPESGDTDVDALLPSTHFADASAGEEATGAGLVLVVDDHPVNRLVMRKQLNTLGYVVEEAESGPQALERWNSGKFALVLTDCHMPGMTGYELSRRIREAEAVSGRVRTPIIACSADALAGAAGTCMDAGMDDYISKPTELRLLGEKVRLWMPRPAGQVDPGSAEEAPPVVGGAIAAEPAPALWAQEAQPRDEPALSRRVIDQFRGVNDADVEHLKDAVGKGDMQAVTHFAHRIKGACGFIGASSMASVCGMVEQAGRAEDGPGVIWLMDVFQTELEQLNAHLDAQ